jgi:hypothetical protein
MKKSIFYWAKHSLLAFALILTVSSCSNDGMIHPTPSDSTPNKSISAPSNPSGRVSDTNCSIVGPTQVSAGSSYNYSYNFSNTTGSRTPTSYIWTVTSAVPVGSVTISANGNQSSILFSPKFKTASISAQGLDSNGVICLAELSIAASTSGGGGVVTCDARVVQIWCSPAPSGYTAEINARVAVSNPFSNTASVLIQWNPKSFSGQLVAGGQYNLASKATATLPTQFDINAQTRNPNGFYVPMIVVYTDLVTGATCTVEYLNPLVTGGCNNAPM